MKGLLEIKEDWAPSAFTLTDKPETISIDTGALRIEFQKKPWKYAVYDKQGHIVVQEHVKDTDTQGNFRGLPMGFTTLGGKVHRSNETFALAQDENFYGLGERFTKLNKLGLRVNGWQANGWGAGTDDMLQGNSLRHEHRRLRNFRQHDIPHSMGHGQPLRGLLLISDRRPATGLSSSFTDRASSKCWLATSKSPAGRHSLPKNPSAFGLRCPAAPRETAARWPWRRSSGTWTCPWIISRRRKHANDESAGRIGARPGRCPRNSASWASRLECT